MSSNRDMEEEIITGLMEFYKEKGIDLYAVLDDPLFARLSNMREKVEVLKRFASHISSGTSRGLSKSDIRNILMDASLAGAFSAAMAGGGIATALSHYKVPGKIPFKALTGGIAIGSGISALTSLYKSRKVIDNRTEIANKLDNLSKNPTDINAIKLLALRNYQVHPNRNLSTPSAIGDMYKAKISEGPMTLMTKIVPNYVQYKTFQKNEDMDNPTPLKEGLTPEIMKKIVEDVGNNIFPNPLNPKKKNF